MSKSHTLPVKIDRGQGRPLVLLHGLGNNHESWQFVLEHLDYSRWRVIVVDLLGFGDAPKPELRYTPRDHSEAVAATLHDLGIEQAVVAGHSMGCIVAIDLAAENPQLVERLVLFGAPLYRREPRASRWRKLVRAEGLYFALFNVVTEIPDLVQAGGQIADELVPFVKGMEITEETWPAYEQSLRHTIMQFESYRQVARLDRPVLFVNGIFDFFIIRRNTYRLRWANRRHVKVATTRGPHELTPQQGKVAAGMIDRFAGYGRRRSLKTKATPHR